MEPNVDRGMWAIVALLIAVVIGGAVMLIFPNFVGQVGNEMSDLLTSPSKIIAKGEMPVEEREFDFINNEELWEVGSLGSMNGDFLDFDTRIRTKYFLDIKGDESYIFSTNNDFIPLAAIFYNSNKEYLRATRNGTESSVTLNVLSDVKYIKLVVVKDCEEKLFPEVITETGIELVRIDK